MNIKLQAQNISYPQHFTLSGSKSESNRMLLIKQLYPNYTIHNLSTSDDTQVLQKALTTVENPVDIHHAGTAMRFLTAYYASEPGKTVTLTGSERMKQRPIAVLVEALQSLGASITYLQEPGYPPLQIIGKQLDKNQVTLSGSVSSQYITALLLIAPKLPNGLQITLTGTLTSVPYLIMTLKLLNEIGVQTTFENNIITVQHTSQITHTEGMVESDWSSASYWYGFMALSNPENSITLSHFKTNSLQGDSALADLYTHLGVKTSFENNNQIRLTKTHSTHAESIEWDLNHCPDIAQTIAVTCYALQIPCTLTGLQTLKIKETDRLLALQNELTKFGASVTITPNSITVMPGHLPQETISVQTYNDHRMAMAFAPLALKTSLIIQNAEVVSKSYPNFWNDLKQFGIQQEIIA